MKKLNVFIFCTSLVLALILPCSLFAQTGATSVRGTNLDKSGAAVVGGIAQPAIPLGSIQRYEYAGVQRSDCKSQSVQWTDVWELHHPAESAARDAVRITVRILEAGETKHEPTGEGQPLQRLRLSAVGKASGLIGRSGLVGPGVPVLFLMSVQEAAFLRIETVGA